ncbi:4-oxalocrotonate tautomerase protein [Rhizobium gallicum]|uniref:4-oxalocrotonate tautomerase protein n=1 Tax=Rhizobium gallicum TaxID=56730 RepID=A0A1L5NHF8_9HYPH|nr:tautomerase family protein [Rhizobium gallicum]APO67353.1 4-oxalocrotonate tautomerase protein [Rhizobium gallicum]
MPLMKIHVLKGRSTDEVERLLDTVHEAMLQAFQVPERDLYQILNEHAASHFRALDTGLDIARTDKFVMIEVVTRPRTRAEKMDFYERLCRLLSENYGVESSDVMVSIVQNTDEDWSFGLGRAQFVTGDLA